MVNRRAKPLLPFALLGCLAAVLAAMGGTWALLGGVLALALVVAFSLLYLTGRIGPQLPPFRVPRWLLVAVVWLLVALIMVAALLLVNVYASSIT